ncbi:small nucleolar ribonucleoprotein complex component (Utp5) [Blumeria hordei DH14]|uniref:Small nucleolar ribonucleoprotein complex component (Utp5) n=1 Tax=Blumeria graminis f. sp. hordei (strain DH14) TaxID=546991 RepID=N1J9Q6_BLUG1|nr:small nucleolar ribonucleoprotein complex component (Utp5) [Blumeria hordei DH14]
MSTKRKFHQQLAQPMLKQSVKVQGKGVLNESRTVVSSGMESWKTQFPQSQDEKIIGHPDSEGRLEDEGSVAEDSTEELDVDMNNPSPIDEDITHQEMEQIGEPSFGDLVRANIPEPIDVSGAFGEPNSLNTNYPTTALQPPSGASLGAVLTQALRTNDTALLETCLHTSDIPTIRGTVQRLESSRAAKLLLKLAERLHKRPGRAGNLMVWIQWTLVAHGGYLATQKDLVQSLAELTKVIDRRSRGLQSVLALKGRLDMLEAQMEFRKSLQPHRRQQSEDEDAGGVIYVEDQEEEALEPKSLVSLKGNGNVDFTFDAKSDISEDMPTTNGLAAYSEDEEEDSSDNQGLIDDEAEESDAETDDVDEIDH